MYIEKPIHMALGHMKVQIYTVVSIQQRRIRIQITIIRKHGPNVYSQPILKFKNGPP